MHRDPLAEFGKVWGASGVTGIFNGGWWYHRPLHTLGLLNFAGSTFVAKTITLNETEGNMKSRDGGITCSEFKPECICLTPKMWWEGIVLNAIALTNPGAESVLNNGQWQSRELPFLISFMSMAKTPEEKLAELRQYVKLLKPKLPEFKARVGQQLNLSCPNVGSNLSEMVPITRDSLNAAAELEIPLVPKFNLSVTPREALEISRHQNCAGICMTNTAPFGKILPRSYWMEHFGTDDPKESPLAKFGGGGLSGKPLFPLVLQWIKDFRALGGKCHVNAGGGILGPDDAVDLLRAGASSIALGSIAMLRPWRVKKTIRAAQLWS